MKRCILTSGRGFQWNIPFSLFTLFFVICFNKISNKAISTEEESENVILNLQVADHMSNHFDIQFLIYFFVNHFSDVVEVIFEHFAKVRW